MARTMNIILNGENVEIFPDSRLLELLDGKNMVTERNQPIKPKQKFVILLNGQICKDNPILQPDDSIDLISFVGGG